LLGISGCLGDSTGPEGFELYVLQRIGSRPLPTYLDASNPNQVVLADTLVVPLRSIRDGGTFVIRRVQVGQNPPEAVYRFEGEHRADVTGNSLVVDTCPIGAYCLATLVYAPFTLAIVGDSLVEVLPEGIHRDVRVYGLLKQTGRVR
jgi:hypothetical protein